MSDAPNPVPNPVLSPAAQSANAKARDELRKHLSSGRRQLLVTQVSEYSSAICDRLLSLIEPSTNLGGYLALGNEVQIEAALNAARQRSCKTYVPIVQSNHQMVFAQTDNDTLLIKNKFGILEPDLTTAVSISSADLDAVLVPLVGFDDQCQRMGMGGGFYDRAFAANNDSPAKLKRPLLIGVAYDIQHTASVLPDWWDVPLDIIVTETRIIRRSKSSHQT